MRREGFGIQWRRAENSSAALRETSLRSCYGGVVDPNGDGVDAGVCVVGDAAGELSALVLSPGASAGVELVAVVVSELRA